MILRKVIKYIIYSDEISFSGTKHKRRYLVCQENIDRKTRCVNDVDGGLKSGFSTAGPDPGKFNRAFNPYF